ncbi:insulinase family protein [Streptomyces sp. MCA2]|uniref:M16 family metallopeptidase n=1 Tax=Streptomyces TaxID=1883 RepID=UPI0020225345|nr:pitrilysin family protein [Streptomyces sp. MCA2]MCL7490020.1 insulinase family protein [Streptomyces sp. MCA2]
MNRFAPMPEVGPPTPLRLPPMADTRLPSGLRVVAARYPSIPMAELRLAIPLAPRTSHEAAVHEVLAATLLQGTASRSHRSIVEALAVTGTTLSVGRTSRWLVLSASGPASAMQPLLTVLSDVLTSARHNDERVEAACGRAHNQVLTTRQQPHVMASEALLGHLYGELPQMEDVPQVAALRGVTGGDVRAAHQANVRPDRAVLIVVGDIDPHQAVAGACAALQPWAAGGTTLPAPCRPVISRPGTAWIRRPGATQSQIRLIRPTISRNDPQYAALTLANVVFGGYFSSRLVAELRERRGLAYRCEASFRDHLDQLVIAVEADTATASAPHTLQGIEQQLRNMAEHPPNSYEVTAARQYVTGMTALAASSQQAWAGSLLLTLTLGQEPDRIAQFLEHLTGVGDDEVAAAAARFYCPDDYHGIVLGDTAALSETDIPQ